MGICLLGKKSVSHLAHEAYPLKFTTYYLIICSKSTLGGHCNGYRPNIIYIVIYCIVNKRLKKGIYVCSMGVPLFPL